MHHSICMRTTIGEEHAHVKHVLFFDCMHSFTMYMQAMTPRRSIISCKLHGQHGATQNFELGHSLGGQREIFHHDVFFPKAPNISHTFSHGERVWAASKWWENHLPHLDLMWVGDALH